MVAVSVVVATRNPGPALPALVRSIDAQSLPATAFELVVVDASDDGSADRLLQLAARRPNVTVLAADPRLPEADRLATARERAAGEYVVVLGQQQRLTRRALELLLETAGRTGADLVLGRAVTAAASGCRVLPEDADLLGGPGSDWSAADAAACIALVRRSMMADGRPTDLVTLVAAAGSVSALGRYACSVEGADPFPSGAGVSLDTPTYRWTEGVLRLSAGLRLPAPRPAGLRSWLVVANGSAELAVPATTGPGPATTALSVTAVLDPRTAEGGQALTDGPWDLRVRLAWDDREVTLPLTGGSNRPAVIEGRPYVVRSAAGAVQLDAGATLTGPVGRVPVARATVAESVHGTLVTLEQPDLHVHGDAVLEARLLLDRFGMPGRLVCVGGRARLEAHVGSLAGTSAVSVAVGAGSPVATGLRLRVDGAGAMSLEEVPRSRPQAPPPAAASTSTASTSTPLVQRLRRRAPAALEPLVHRLADVPVLRSTYRRLLSR